MDNKLGIHDEEYQKCDVEVMKKVDFETAIKYYNVALTDKEEAGLSARANEIVQGFFAKLTSLEKIFMLYNKKVSNVLPIVDLGGAAWFYTNEDDAKTAAENNGENTEYKAIDNKHLTMLIRYEFQRFGINVMRLNPTVPELAATVSFSFNSDGFTTNSFGNGAEFNNSAVYSAIYRYLQIMAAPEAEGVGVHRENLKKMLFSAINDAVFIIPVKFDTKTNEESDRICYTKTTEQFLNAAKRSCRFFSTEKLDWEKKASMEVVQFSTIENKSGQKFFPIFTDVIEYDRMVRDKKCRKCAISIRELMGYMPRDCGGAVINCAGLSFAVTPEMWDFKGAIFKELIPVKEDELKGPVTKEALSNRKLYAIMLDDNPFLINDEHVAIFTTAKRAQKFAAAVKNNKIRIMGIETKDQTNVFSHYYQIFGVETLVLDNNEGEIFNICELFDLKKEKKESGEKKVENIKNPSLKKALIVRRQYVVQKGKGEERDPVGSALLYNVLLETENAELIVPALKHGEGVAIPLLKEEAGDALIPVFTDFLHLAKVKDKIKFDGAAVYTAKSLVKNLEAGFIVNPGGAEATVISREMLDKFFETVASEKINENDIEKSSENDEVELQKSEEEQEKGSVFGKFMNAYNKLKK